MALEQGDEAVKTFRYWKISKIWNSKTKESITVENALHDLKCILETTDPAKPVAQRAGQLITDIIYDQQDLGAINETS